MCKFCLVVRLVSGVVIGIPFAGLGYVLGRAAAGLALGYEIGRGVK